MVNAVAAGVLTGATFLHVYPEGLAMVALGDTAEQMLITGVAVLCGCCLGLMLDLVLDSSQSKYDIFGVQSLEPLPSQSNHQPGTSRGPQFATSGASAGPGSGSPQCVQGASQHTHQIFSPGYAAVVQSPGDHEEPGPSVIVDCDKIPSESQIPPTPPSPPSIATFHPPSLDDISIHPPSPPAVTMHLQRGSASFTPALSPTLTVANPMRIEPSKPYRSPRSTLDNQNRPVGPPLPSNVLTRSLPQLSPSASLSSLSESSFDAIEKGEGKIGNFVLSGHGVYDFRTVSTLARSICLRSVLQNVCCPYPL